MDGCVDGEGIVLPGLGRDQRPQRSVGGEGPMVPVAVDAGWGEDFGQPIQKLQSREAQGGAAGGVGLRQEVEDLVRAAADQVEPVEGKGGPGTIPDQALEADSVGGLDADVGVETEPTAVIPAEHVLGVVGLQEALAPEPSGPAGEGAERCQKMSRETIE